MLVVSVHSCSLYRSSAQSAHTFETSSEYALKPIRHNCIDVGTSIIKHICKVYVSERMRDCPGVGGRKYDVECEVVRWGPIGYGGVISHTVVNSHPDAATVLTNRKT